MNFYMRHSKEGDVKIYSKQNLFPCSPHIFIMYHGSRLVTRRVLLWAKMIDIHSLIF